MYPHRSRPQATLRLHYKYLVPYDQIDPVNPALSASSELLTEYNSLTLPLVLALSYFSAVLPLPALPRAVIVPLPVAFMTAPLACSRYNIKPKAQPSKTTHAGVWSCGRMCVCPRNVLFIVPSRHLASAPLLLTSPWSPRIPSHPSPFRCVPFSTSVTSYQQLHMAHVVLMNGK
jgi:hypothetical protein